MSDAASAPAPPALLPLPPNIGEIAASQVIGSLLNWFLYGILAVQVYIWRLTFPDDKAAIKWLVYIIFLVETVATALNGWDMYYWFAAGFGDIIMFSKVQASAWYTPMLGGLMALVVQTFFCYRIYIIKREAWWFCIFVFLISLLQASGGLGGGISAYLAANTEHDHIRQIFVAIWLIGEMIADILIASSMSYLLLRAGQNQHRQTNDIVRRIVRLTVETNTASTIVAIVSVILFYGTPNTTYFIAPTMVLAKLYANTLLVTFNNRAFIHGSNGGSQVVSGSMSSNTYAGSGRAGKRGTRTRSLPFSAGLDLGANSTAELEPISFATNRVTVTSRTFGSTTQGTMSIGGGQTEYGRPRGGEGEMYTLDRLDAPGTPQDDKPAEVYLSDGRAL
ncbi:hypothetical protein MKEN_00453100 [Mycena kentingensis (nom. inval.)]|nr:hypothetical protein MKEN_00453100 [Mycena kentingensis (nom. inval.)]